MTGCGNQHNAEITSPDNNIKIKFELYDSVLYYLVYYKNNKLIHRSKMGFILKDQPYLSDGFYIDTLIKSSFDETWKPVWGETSEIRNNFNQMKYV